VKLVHPKDRVAKAKELCSIEYEFEFVLPTDFHPSISFHFSCVTVYSGIVDSPFKLEWERHPSSSFRKV
jgi:hypothetical protein